MEWYNVQLFLKHKLVLFFCLYTAALVFLLDFCGGSLISISFLKVRHFVLIVTLQVIIPLNKYLRVTLKPKRNPIAGLVLSLMDLLLTLPAAFSSC